MLKTFTDARDLQPAKLTTVAVTLDFQQQGFRLIDGPICNTTMVVHEPELAKAESQPPNNQQAAKEKARRSRKDEQGRNYNCGCGKKYLSYPALYTHIRNKHFGKTPEGTRNSASNATKRGRPKRQSSDATERMPETYVQLEDLTILKHLDDNYEGQFDLASDYREVLDDTLTKFYRLILNRQSEDKPDPNTPFGLVLAHFIIGISRLLNHTLCWHYIQFLKMVYKCFEENACEVLNNCFKGQNSKLADIKHSIFEGEIPQEQLLQSSFLVPLLGDYLFRTYLPNKNTQANMHLSILMFCDLCRWLSRMRLTKIQLDINLPYRQEFELATRSKNN